MNYFATLGRLQLAASQRVTNSVAKNRLRDKMTEFPTGAPTRQLQKNCRIALDPPTVHRYSIQTYSNREAAAQARFA